MTAGQCHKGYQLVDPEGPGTNLEQLLVASDRDVKNAPLRPFTIVAAEA